MQDTRHESGAYAVILQRTGRSVCQGQKKRSAGVGSIRFTGPGSDTALALRSGRTVMSCARRTLLSNRRGFTLVELVVVILILGILASVAAGRFADTAGQARDNGLRGTLKVVRTAIELYRARNDGRFPGDDGTEAGLKADLKPHLRRFPGNPIKSNSTKVAVITAGTPLAFDGGSDAWLYDNQTGQFIANSNGTFSETGQRYDEL